RPPLVLLVLSGSRIAIQMPTFLAERYVLMAAHVKCHDRGREFEMSLLRGVYRKDDGHFLIRAVGCVESQLPFVVVPRCIVRLSWHAVELDRPRNPLDILEPYLPV